VKRPKRLFKQRGNPQRVVAAEQLSITGEAEYIVARAMAKEGRIVTLGVLVFFSTSTGDAWLLDADDSLALRLAVEGKRQPVTIYETPKQFGIEWEGTFQIDGDVMVFVDREGKSLILLGYPTREIATAVSRARS
jgi:hypothetical protein